MLLAEPPPTQWDLHFQLLGIPVRISPWFWLVGALLGWDSAQYYAAISRGQLTVGVGLIIWTAAIFMSILIHEFGHALAFRNYGIESEVVLYQFGGLAIPRRSFEFGRQQSLNPQRQIVISAAGPAVQLLLGAVIVAILYVGGYAVDNPIPFVSRLNFLTEGRELPSPALFALSDALISCSIWWALMNLLPVYPLDGGQISRELLTLTHPRDGIRYSLLISIAVGIAIAVWALTHDRYFMGLLFASLAYGSYMTLQAYSGRGGGFGGGQW